MRANYGDAFRRAQRSDTVQHRAGSVEKWQHLVASVTLSSTGYAATAMVAGSPHTITASAAVFTPAADTNYAITYHSGQFTVEPCPVGHHRDSWSRKSYGDTFTPNGATQFSTAPAQLKNGDVVAAADACPAQDTQRQRWLLARLTRSRRVRRCLLQEARAPITTSRITTAGN